MGTRDASKRNMDKLKRNKVSTLFKARTRMLKAMAHFKKGQRNLRCRACRTVRTYNNINVRIVKHYMNKKQQKQ